MSNQPNTDLLRQLPQVDEVLQLKPIVSALMEQPRETIVSAVRDAIAYERARILEGASDPADAQTIAQRAREAALQAARPSLRRVVNASGVVVHTNLGRSMLAREAIEAVNDVIRGYSTLEYSVANMARGSRHDHCEGLICELTGAEAALAVNNNAAAVMMVLSEFASGKQAIVSRGELVEIGGSFRIPDIMQLSGASMVEVGTTNKTHPIDYDRAVTPETAMLLKVHPSNYRMIGFTESVGIDKLRQIADAVPGRLGTAAPLVYEDQGSGALLHLDAFGTYAEPTVAASLAAGADIVSFSGDKLLGGPQAGIIVGRKDLIDRLKSNPLARALRLDKMTLAALEATLRLYREPARAMREIPTLRMLTESPEDVRQRAEALAEMARALVDCSCAEFRVVEEISRAGGGALPMCDIPTYALEVRLLKGNAQDCGRFLVQECPVPIIARINHETVLFDARTLTEADELRLAAAGLSGYFEQLGEEAR